MMHLSMIRAIAVGCLLIQLMSVPVVRAEDPTSTPTADNVTSQTIAGETFVNPATTPVFVALARYILPPGTSITSGETTGPRLIYVESGQLSIQSSADDRGYLRATDAPPWADSSSGKGADLVLPAGTHYQLVIADTAFDFANEGARAATFLDAIVFASAPTSIVPYTTMDGVVVDPLVVAVGVTVPSRSIDLEVARVELGANAALDLPTSTGPRLFVIESGTLQIANETGAITYSSSAGLNHGSQPGRSRPISPGDATVLRARGSIVVEAGASGRITNTGRGRLVLLGLFVKAGP
jgi:hypothetical protein